MAGDAQLLATLSRTETHFVRCMKPNLQMAPRTFDSEYVRSRVRAAGSLSALKFMRKLQGGGEIQLSTLMRLRAKKELLDQLPASLHKVTEPAAFAEALLVALKVPREHFRVAGDVVTMCTALLPFVGAMETEGPSADAAAAAQIATHVKAATVWEEGERRRAEREAKVAAASGMGGGAPTPARAATAASTRRC